MNRLILASASPRRADLLRSLEVEFDVIPSRAAELDDAAIGAVKLCELNALRKAEEVARRHPERIVLGADTLVTRDNEVFGKPADLSEAFAMLSRLSAKAHQVITGVALLHHAENRREIFTDETVVTFKQLDDATIRQYLETVPVLDKAGAYGIQERGELLVERISGSLSNVIGLPIEKVSETFLRWGIPHSTRSR
jgi:septum formation protein